MEATTPPTSHSPRPHCPPSSLCQWTGNRQLCGHIMSQSRKRPRGPGQAFPRVLRESIPRSPLSPKPHLGGPWCTVREFLISQLECRLTGWGLGHGDDSLQRPSSGTQILADPLSPVSGALHTVGAQGQPLNEVLEETGRVPTPMAQNPLFNEHLLKVHRNRDLGAHFDQSWWNPSPSVGK